MTHPTTRYVTPVEKFNALWNSIEKHIGIAPDCECWAEEIRAAMSMNEADAKIVQRAVNIAHEFLQPDDSKDIDGWTNVADEAHELLAFAELRGITPQVEA